MEIPDGGRADNVTAFVVELGETNGQLSCSPAGWGATESIGCLWFGILDVDAGGYTIQVAAPGYQTVNVPVTLTASGPVPGAACQCAGGALSPNFVVLMPGDGGTGDAGP